MQDEVDTRKHQMAFGEVHTAYTPHRMWRSVVNARQMCCLFTVENESSGVVGNFVGSRIAVYCLLTMP